MSALRLDAAAEEIVRFRVQRCRERRGTCLHRPAEFVRAVRHWQGALALNRSSGIVGPMNRSTAVDVPRLSVPLVLGSVRAVTVHNPVRGRHRLAAPTAGVEECVWTVCKSLPGGDAAGAQCRLVAEHDVCSVRRRATVAAVGLQASLEKVLEGACDASHHLRSGLDPDLVVDHTD